MRLLSVDFDYFFPVQEGPNDGPHWMLYDWSSGETGIFSVPDVMAAIWAIRAQSFTRKGLSLPDTQGLERGFWDRFRLAPDAQLWVADSHSQIARPEIRAGVTSVWNYDAHHDAGYNTTRKGILNQAVVTCDNWMAAYSVQGARTHVRYPQWRGWQEREPRTAWPVNSRKTDPGGRVRGTFDRVFICRSGAWVPPWLDHVFGRFVASCPIPAQQVTKLDLPKRPWNPDMAQRMDSLFVCVTG